MGCVMHTGNVLARDLRPSIPKVDGLGVLVSVTLHVQGKAVTEVLLAYELI